MAGFATQETELNSYKSSSLHLKAPRKTVPKLDLKKVFEVAQQEKLKQEYDFVDFD